MLFDLRSRRRQTTVRIVYVFLALVMGGGLILVGVGTGTGGGLLNAFTNNGGGGGGKSADPLIAKQVKNAITATKQHPNSATAWKSLMNARLSEAQTSSNYNTTTHKYTASGTTALKNGVTAWEQYLKVTGDKPDITGAELARSLYQGLGDYLGMAKAYQYIVKLEPKLGGAYTCLAYTAYAAGNATQLGDLAAAKAVQLAPKLQKLTLKQNFSKAKQSVTTAQTDVANYC